jgi:hypothetical protein
MYLITVTCVDGVECLYASRKVTLAILIICHSSTNGVCAC